MDTVGIRVSVEAAMNSYLEAILALDVDRAVSHYLNDTAMHVWSDGVRYDYSGWVAAARANLAALRSLEGAWGDMTVVPLSPEAAVASASFQETMTDQSGGVHQIRGAVSWVWVLRGGRWKIIHGHAVHQAGEGLQ
jgi:ketosteroid isomerase-like protein